MFENNLFLKFCSFGFNFVNSCVRLCTSFRLGQPGMKRAELGLAHCIDAKVSVWTVVHLFVSECDCNRDKSY